MYHLFVGNFVQKKKENKFDEVTRILHFVFGDISAENIDQITRKIYKENMDLFLLWEEIYWNNLRNIVSVVPIWSQYIRKGPRKNGKNN